MVGSAVAVVEAVPVGHEAAIRVAQRVEEMAEEATAAASRDVAMAAATGVMRAVLREEAARATYSGAAAAVRAADTEVVMAWVDGWAVH